MVLVGSRCRELKYVGGPPLEFSWPIEEKMLGVLGLEEADCVFSCVNVRVEEAESTASGDILEVARGRAVRIKPEAVEAARRVRDAIMEVDGVR